MTQFNLTLTLSDSAFDFNIERLDGAVIANHLIDSEPDLPAQALLEALDNVTTGSKNEA